MTATIRRACRITVAVILAVLGLLAAGVSTAAAGTYTYVDSSPATSGNWAAGPYDGSRIALYSSGGGALLARNVIGDFSSANGTTGGYSTTAPAGLQFAGASLKGSFLGGASWKTVWGTAEAIQGACGGNPGCPSVLGGPVNSRAVTIAVSCIDGGGCPNSGQVPRAQAILGEAELTVNDPNPPSIAITGGDIPDSGWVGGVRDVIVDATDNTGIRSVTPSIDSEGSASQFGGECNFHQPLPCPQARNARIKVDVSTVSPGTHQLTVTATDTGSNDKTSAARTIRVDNTPPASPDGLAVADGPVFRSTNGFAVAWANPPQADDTAPIVGARYQLCPAGQPQNGPGCVNGDAAGENLSRIDGLKLPGPGSWSMRLWLVDAAGNAIIDNGTTIAELGYDDTPPRVGEIASVDPRDPARVSASAADQESAISRGSIELRRKGGKSWRAIKTRVRGGRITAVIPDRALKRGRYRLRALATNRAGLTAGSGRRNGKIARVKLPIRISSRLTVKRAGTTRSRIARVAIGRRVKLVGRLTSKRKGLGRPIAVLQRVSYQGARYTRVATIRTDKKGRFTYKAPAGRARTLLFSFGGGRFIANDTATVDLRVQAKLRLRVNDRSVRNGDTITFSGRLAGGTLPPEGAQLAAQVYSRGKWRPFATPTTDANGRFRFPYQFETVVGRARFRFRVVILKGPTYAYYGASKPIRVTVRGQ